MRQLTFCHYACVSSLQPSSLVIYACRCPMPAGTAKPYACLDSAGLPRCVRPTRTATRRFIDVHARLFSCNIEAGGSDWVVSDTSAHMCTEEGRVVAIGAGQDVENRGP